MVFLQLARNGASVSGSTVYGRQRSSFLDSSGIFGFFLPNTPRQAFSSHIWICDAVWRVTCVCRPCRSTQKCHLVREMPVCLSPNPPADAGYTILGSAPQNLVGRRYLTLHPRPGHKSAPQTEDGSGSGRSWDEPLNRGGRRQARQNGYRMPRPARACRHKGRFCTLRGWWTRWPSWSGRALLPSGCTHYISRYPYQNLESSWFCLHLPSPHFVSMSLDCWLR